MGDGPIGTDSENLPPIGGGESEDEGMYPGGSRTGGPGQPRPSGGGGGGDQLPPEWQALIDQFPKWEDRIMAAWNQGWSLAKTTRAIEKIVEKREEKGEKKDPMISAYSNSYFHIWGEPIPESEIEYAKAEGMNSYEFVQYQRSKAAFTETELFEQESTGMAGQLADLFGMGQSLGSSMTPIDGTGAPY